MCAAAVIFIEIILIFTCGSSVIAEVGQEEDTGDPLSPPAPSLPRPGVFTLCLFPACTMSARTALYVTPLKYKLKPEYVHESELRGARFLHEVPEGAEDVHQDEINVQDGLFVGNELSSGAAGMVYHCSVYGHEMV